ncbi:MAG: hypothetical protein IT372_24265 [Polyangiaceae bacterium]|nr:hypothetical protein [Polyangiaceae bacterium]
MRRRITVFHPTIIEAMRVRSALDDLETASGTSGAVAEAVDDIAPRAFAIAARGKRGRPAGGAALAVRRHGARAGGRE